MSDQTPPPPPLPGGANPYAATPQPMSPADEKLWAILVHVGSLVLSWSGLGWLVALIGYLVLKDRGPFVRAHTATALNFHLTMLIAYIVGVVLIIVFVGFLVIAAVSVVIIVFGIIAALAANRGEYYEYPISIKFVS
jgi:uncharacterized Tic20 family protein